MNSEKVKEIKKALEERTQHKPINCYNGEYVEACGMYCKFYRKFVSDMGSNNRQICEDCGDFTATDKVKIYADTLTLINELESENKSLQDLCNKTYEDLTKEIDRLENCVKELEEGIAKSMLGCEFLPECTKEKEKEVIEKFTKAVYKELYQLGRIYALPETFDADKYGIFSLTQEVVARIAKEEWNKRI